MRFSTNARTFYTVLSDIAIFAGVIGMFVGAYSILSHNILSICNNNPDITINLICSSGLVGIMFWYVILAGIVAYLTVMFGPVILVFIAAWAMIYG